MTDKFKIEEKIKTSKRENRSPVLYFNELLIQCPVERRFLLPGKLYVFKYKTDKKKIYDGKPYIMSLGQDKEKPYLFYGIDMHHMPYQIRLQFFIYIYDIFYDIIYKESNNFPLVEDAVKQASLPQMTGDNVSHMRFNLKPSIHRYSIEHMSDCKLINYNLIHYMLQDETDYFKNGSIVQAQNEFLTANAKSK